MIVPVVGQEVYVSVDGYLIVDGVYNGNHIHGQILDEVETTVVTSSAGGPTIVRKEKSPLIRLEDGTVFFGYERSDWRHWTGCFSPMRPCCAEAYRRAGISIPEDRIEEGKEP